MRFLIQTTYPSGERYRLPYKGLLMKQTRMRPSTMIIGLEGTYLFSILLAIHLWLYVVDHHLR
jgi:hypothetical protein